MDEVKYERIEEDEDMNGRGTWNTVDTGIAKRKISYYSENENKDFTNLTLFFR